MPANPPTTPIARSKTAALARILDCVPRGYHRYTFGTVKAGKAEALARKFHALYGIGCTPAQRVDLHLKLTHQLHRKLTHPKVMPLH